MDQKQIVRQMMEYNKTILDNNFRSMAFLQEQTEHFIFRFLERAQWIPDDGKKAMNEWVNTYKKGIEDFKSYADDNYKKAMDYFTTTQNKKDEKMRKNHNSFKAR